MYCEKFMNTICTHSGWASDAAFASTQGCLRGNWNTIPQEGGVILYNHDGKLVVDGGDECRHLLIIGATGTGKSRLIILPSLIYSLRARKRRSFVVFDVKGELKEATLQIARDNHYNILDVNFRDPSLGDPWNPFYKANALYATGTDENMKKARTLLEKYIDSIFSDGRANRRNDPYWRTNCANLFRGICSILWGLGKSITLRDVLRLSDSIPISREDEDDDVECQLFRLAGPVPGRIRCQASSGWLQERLQPDPRQYPELLSRLSVADDRPR